VSTRGQHENPLISTRKRKSAYANAARQVVESGTLSGVRGWGRSGTDGLKALRQRKSGMSECTRATRTRVEDERRRRGE
jgi:hypothetical protein